MIIKFSRKIFRKEWRKLLLPFLSVALTGMVVTTSFLLIDSAREFLLEKNREFLGGDISYESSRKFSIDSYIPQSLVKTTSEQVTFSGILASKDKTSGASFRVVDTNYPLYGKMGVKSGQYAYLKENEILIDSTISDNLGVGVGDSVKFGESDFIVKDIILQDPQSLLSGFNFLGKVVLGMEAIEYSKIDLNLFRKEYEVNVALNKKLSKSDIAELRSKLEGTGVRGRFDNGSGSGFQFGLEVVERFLIIAVLIISILSLVNIYASVNYLANRLRRSFAILISLGLNIQSIYKILFVINFFVILLGTSVGIVGGYFITLGVIKVVLSMFSLELPSVINYLELALIFIAILLTSIFATLPVLNRMRRISPKELLSHSSQNETKSTKTNIVVDVVIGILPITFLAIYFLESLLYGIGTVLLIVLTYALVMLFYYYFISFTYAKRNVFPFSIKMVVAQKKFDAFFGLITFASLFVALTAVYNLSILRTSIQEYLERDLKRTLPSVYVLDVQNSQIEKVKEGYSDLSLFPNVRARIDYIDELNIQDAVENGVEGVDRELGREFNLTFRDELLPSEQVDEGVWQGDRSGEISVEKDFAERANIKIGSEMIFTIQGFQVKGRVTSIREVDTRSGYPFFYFILNERDIGEYPKTFFGYANYSPEKTKTFGSHLAEVAPNVTLINTGSITALAEDLVEVLLVLILIITVPPLILSTLLIITILSSVAKERKRDGARLMALGKTHTFIRNYYIVESASTSILASFFAYGFAILLSNFVIIKYLKIDSVVYFDLVSFVIFLSIIIGIVLVSLAAWRSGGKSLKEYLNYEENN